MVTKIREDEAEMIADLKAQVVEATQRVYQYEGAFSSCLMKILLEWFWDENSAFIAAQSKAARKERRKYYRDRGFRNPCDDIHSSINQWMKQGAVDHGYSKQRSQRTRRVKGHARHAGSSDKL